jgi:hypothetical protein
MGLNCYRRFESRLQRWRLAFYDPGALPQAEMNARLWRYTDYKLQAEMTVAPLELNGNVALTTRRKRIRNLIRRRTLDQGPISLVAIFPSN